MTHIQISTLKIVPNLCKYHQICCFANSSFLQIHYVEQFQDIRYFYKECYCIEENTYFYMNKGIEIVNRIE